MNNRTVLKGAMLVAAMAFAGSALAAGTLNDAATWGALNDSNDELSGGVASAVAVASLPGAYQANQSAVSVGTGYYKDEGALAVGLSTVTESGVYVLDLNASVNTQSDVAVGAGVAVTW